MKFLSMFCVFATVSIFSQSSHAESYLGFGVGNASLDLKPLFGTRELEDSPMLKGFLGYRLEENVAVEVDLSLGDFDWVNSAGNSHTVVNISGCGVAFLPLGGTFELFAKFGATMSSTTVEYQAITNISDGIDSGDLDWVSGQIVFIF